MSKKDDSAPQWTSKTVPPFEAVWQRLSVTDYAIDSGGRSPEDEFVEERYFCLVLDKKHTLFEDMHTLDVRADAPTLRPKDLYDAWTERTRNE